MEPSVAEELRRLKILPGTERCQQRRARRGCLQACRVLRLEPFAHRYRRATGRRARLAGHYAWDGPSVLHRSWAFLTHGPMICITAIMANMVAPDIRSLGLAPVFSPAQAAEILRNLGLEDLTECALRTRAYRRQIPFHQNGRRITFTADDIREIAEGQPHRPEPRARAERSAPAQVAPVRRRRSPAEVRDVVSAPWRARRAQGA